MPLHDFRSVHLPYCLQKQGRYVVLNREYAPRGFRTKSFDYENYPIAVRFKGLTKKVAAAISLKGSDDLDTINLYDDGFHP